MRDVLFQPLTDEIELVISTDCSGGIGEKADDEVFAPNHVVAYYAMRVSIMELMAVGAVPTTIILSNFTGDSSWNEYMAGIKQVSDELELCSLPVVGSTESNMSLLQSGLGLTVLGNIEKQNKRINRTPANACFAVIGEPLVGESVVKEKERIAPLSLFRKCLDAQGIYELVPVGSKGILHELTLLLKANGIAECNVNSLLNLHQSSGPATCFLISYNKLVEENLQKIAGQLFHKLSIY